MTDWKVGRVTEGGGGHDQRGEDREGRGQVNVLEKGNVHEMKLMGIKN